MGRLRFALLAGVACLVLLSPAGAGTGGGAARDLQARPDLSHAILAELNALRAKRGLRPLVTSGSLAQAAARHSTDMARRGFFSHTSPDGRPFTKRVRQYYPSQGYRVWRVGENLLWGSPDLSPTGAIRTWLGSSSHRNLLLMPQWREVGLGVVHARQANGDYGGLEVTIVTADFGTRVR